MRVRSYALGMFTRLRWFVIGSIATLGATVLVVNRVRTMKAQLTTEGVARAAASVMADTIEVIGTRLQRSALRDVSDGSGSNAG